MIGYLIGKVVESFEEELILVTSSGVGYQVFFSNRAVCGDQIEVFIKHINSTFIQFSFIPCGRSK